MTMHLPFGGNMKRRMLPTVLGLLTVATGCAESHTSDGFVVPVRSGLVRAQSCAELEGALQDDAIAKVQLEANRYYEILDRYGLDYSDSVDDGIAPPSAVDAGVSEEPTGEPQAGGDTGGEGRAYSETNAQVAGVDEADFVKTDGTRIYIASGKQLHVLNAWPAANTALERSIELEGYASELFVADGQVIVFETVPGSAELGARDLCARPSYGGGSGGFADGGGDQPEPAPEPTDAGTPEPDPDLPPETDAGPADESDPVPPEDEKPTEEPSDSHCYGAFTKISVIDLAGEPTLTSETYYEGNYLTSRRHDDAVRAIIQSHVYTPVQLLSIEQYAYQEGIEQPMTESEARQIVSDWVDAATQAARQTTLDDWLPARAARVDGQLQALPPSCSDFYLPSPGLTNYGLTQIAGVSLTDGSLGGAAILGQTAQVYANRGALVLAHHDWSWNLREAEGSQTALHVFALGDGLSTVYQGSGFAPGNLLNQFSIHEKDGTYFVATTQDLWGGWPVAVEGTPGDTVEVDAGSGSSGGGSSGGGSAPPPEDAGTSEEDAPIGSSENPLDGPEPPYSFVTALELENGQLQIVGQSSILAPGERIFSARFVGDRAYVVTFRQVDPLFAIDISQPTNLRVLGELKIPGFSNYMHPLSDNHLLTIGREIDPNTNVDLGLSLQIFDVSDATAPALAHKHVFSREGWSEANANHKAFTYYAEKKILAFPFISYEGAFESSLQLFEVDVTTGLTPLGQVSHTDQIGSACGWEDSVEPVPGDAVRSCSISPEIRRGLFIEDNVYAISWAGVSAHSLSDLNTSLAEVSW